MFKSYISSIVSIHAGLTNDVPSQASKVSYGDTDQMTAGVCFTPELGAWCYSVEYDQKDNGANRPSPYIFIDCAIAPTSYSDDHISGRQNAHVDDQQDPEHFQRWHRVKSFFGVCWNKSLGSYRRRFCCYHISSLPFWIWPQLFLK